MLAGFTPTNKVMVMGTRSSIVEQTITPSKIHGNFSLSMGSEQNKFSCDADPSF
jgi:hypothetical protein